MITVMVLSVLSWNRICNCIHMGNKKAALRGVMLVKEAERTIYVSRRKDTIGGYTKLVEYSIAFVN